MRACLKAAEAISRQCKSCGDVSAKRAVVNSEVDRCLKCGFEAYVWSFKEVTA